MALKSTLFFAVALFCFSACREQVQTEEKMQLFSLLDSVQTGISFVNKLEYTEQLNTYTFRNFYNGGGIGIGDFNNDGLPDVFFSGNMVPNKLYLNQGGFKFKDISASAGVSHKGSWTTGVSIADVNADGWLDIYLCKSGPPEAPHRTNELLINNGNLTFTDKAKEFGLDFKGLSTHAAFFDYDKDGDLDCYLLNNSIRSVGGYDLRKGLREIPDTLGGNRLLRNDSVIFKDVSTDAGIFTSQVGFGLGVTVGDINQDGWPDVFVSNDFFEKDYLYINQQNGKFVESLESYMREISLGSMGADMADINNDALPDIFVTEMLPETDERLKTTSQFENWDKYQLAVSQGYYHQFSRNALQLNNGNSTFSEVSRLAGVSATDWSWGALIFDMDNDGLKDIFVANGIFKDLLNQDYVNFIAQPDLVREILKKEKNVIKRLVDSIPSNKIPNYAFQNKGDLTFANRSTEWGLGTPSHSNGSAYADLDNDGDLDLVLNNVNMDASIYRNNSRELFPQHNSVTFLLHGEGNNTFGTGSKVLIKTKGLTLYQELSPMRGFMSSVDYRLQFGVDTARMLDTVRITWPGNRVSLLTNVKVNQVHEISEKDAAAVASITRLTLKEKQILQKVDGPSGASFVHKENVFSDFDRDRLLYNMISNEGPCLCKGDVNADGLDDFYAGGARDQSGRIFIQKRDGTFYNWSQPVFDEDSDSEDVECIFFDSNGDGFDDLYVASGSNEFAPTSPALADRLYVSNGKNGFVKSQQVFPVKSRYESTSAVSAGDFDGDDDQDLFVGVRLLSFKYGIPVNGYVLQNDGNGLFTDVTASVAPGLLKLGMITSGLWVDINIDRKPDLLVTGEWMGIKVFVNGNGKLIDKSDEYGLANSNGWYTCLAVEDLNGDHFPDFIAGNHGLNSRFKASKDKPIELFVNDFDQNGTIEHIMTMYNGGRSFPLVLRNDLVSQIPSLKKKYLRYQNYKNQSVNQIFSDAQLKSALHLKAYDLTTSVYLNEEGVKFRKVHLPPQAQFAPVYSILPLDFDGDRHIDLLLGGNLYRAKPETGIYDGSYGLLLKGDGNGNFTSVSPLTSGICIKGEVRSFQPLQNLKTNLIVVGKNNDKNEFYSY
jgi:enediyne biosynthesis protein E4